MKNIHQNLKTLALISSLVVAIAPTFANSGYWDPLPHIPNYPNTSINSIAVDSKGNIYAATGFPQFQTGIAYRLNRWSPTWQQIGGTSPDGTAFNTITVDKYGNVFVGSGYGWVGHVYELPAGNSQWQLVGELTTFIDPIEKIATDSNGEVYIGIAASGGSAYKINPTNDQRWQAVVGDNPYSPDYTSIYSIALDSSNNFYVGTYSGSIYEAVTGSNQWKQVGSRENPSSSGVFAIGLTDNGSIFEGSWGAYFYQILNGGSTWQDTAGRVPDGNRVNTITVDKLNNVFVGTGSLTPGSVFRLSPPNYNQWVQVGGTSPDGYPVNSSAIDLYDQVYVSTTHNIYFLENPR